MTHSYFFALATLATMSLLVRWRLEFVYHQRRLNQKKYRIHVNGIRGKSTVTRLLAAILRASNCYTIAKTTGSAACVIGTDGADRPIHRYGSPTILEQIEIIRSIPDAVDGLVMECMAIKPEYQKICERMIVQSNIGVITNVREDHQDILGESLEEIAFNLLSTCPENGILITAEKNPDLLAIFENVTNRKNSRLIVANEDRVSDQEVSQFHYVAFKENIAIGLELARLIGVDRTTAMTAMQQAAPDPGVFEVVPIQYGQRNLIWADMFAVNDRQSVIMGMNRLKTLVDTDAIKIGILNNRNDREDRALRFAQLVSLDVRFDYIALMGAYENRVERELLENGFPAEKIIRLGSHRNIPDSDLIPQLAAAAGDQNNIALIGLVNIHTHQAEVIREFVNRAKQNRGAK
ncbi:MAG: poly-gamma-glutamate synthase PgsB [Planctomycetota bacterium]